MQVQKSHIDYLIQKSEQALADLPVFPFKRYIYHHIDWDKRIVGIKGLQGTGKTSILIHALRKKIKFNPELKGIYISLDDLFFTEVKLKVVLSGLYIQGYRVFAFDQVHFYSDWEQDFDSALEFFPDCSIFFAGSSLLEVREQSPYKLFQLEGLSFREYLQPIVGMSLPFLNLKQITEQTEEVNVLLSPIKRPHVHLNSFFESSFFPAIDLLVEDIPAYLNRLIRNLIDSELSQIKGFDANQTKQIIHLFYLLLAEIGKKPMITTLGEQCGIHRNTLPSYLRLLEQTQLIDLIYSDYEPGSQQKPEQIVTTHPIFRQIGHFDWHPRLIQQQFVISMLKKCHKVRQLRNGIIEVDDAFTFVLPVEGRMRTLPKNEPYFIVKEKTNSEKENEIPVWLFGFLY